MAIEVRDNLETAAVAVADLIRENGFILEYKVTERPRGVVIAIEMDEEDMEKLRMIQAEEGLVK